jgi:deoxyribodipyrimidine photo-lyase
MLDISQSSTAFPDFDRKHLRQKMTLYCKNKIWTLGMTKQALFWHRRDLRIADNLGLVAACADNRPVIGIFCFDPIEFTPAKIAPASVSYVLASLQLLQQAYRAQGSDLIVVQGDPQQQIPAIAKSLHIQAVYCNELVEPSRRQVDQDLATQLQQLGISFHRYWDALLHAPETIYSGSNSPYSVYTPYWRNWLGRPKPDPQGVASLRPVTIPAQQPLPTLADLGFSWDAPHFLPPGTAAALARLELFASQAIDQYGTDRNFPAIDGTSCLSPALTWGTLGIRTVWQATVQAMERANSPEARAGVTTWQQELAWREFYWQAMYHFPSLIDGPYRSLWQKFPWSNDRSRFEAWCAGKTGYPIVDAAMRQLNATGWMHNRCRMIVASFLTKDLIINWQWGEQYFMQTLVDGDPAANNGGWQWSASSGMDPKPLRIFNPYTQSQKFDREAAYIKKWLPELKSLSAADLISGNIAPLWRSKSNYPEPIVDHAIQQREFKRLYQDLKEDLKVAQE